MQTFVGILALVLSLASLLQGKPVSKENWLKDFMDLTCKEGLKLAPVEVEDNEMALGCFAERLEALYDNCSKEDSDLIEKIEETLYALQKKPTTRATSGPSHCTSGEKSMEPFETFKGKLIDLVQRVNNKAATVY